MDKGVVKKWKWRRQIQCGKYGRIVDRWNRRRIGLECNGYCRLLVQKRKTMTKKSGKEKENLGEVKDIEKAKRKGDYNKIRMFKNSKNIKVKLG